MGRTLEKWKINKEYCRICDFACVYADDEVDCNYWSCPVGEIVDCDDKQIDGMIGNE